MLNVRHHLRLLAVPVCAGLVCLGAAAAAAAQTGATVTPNKPNKGARIHWQVDGTVAPINGLIPTSLTMSAPSGFTLNTAAVAKRCTTLQAKLNECPKASKIGTAVLTIHVEKPSGPRDLPINIGLYLGRKNSLLAIAFLAGIRVVPGSISGAHGIAVTFNPLPVPPVIQGVSYSFIGVRLDLGTSLTITKRIKVRIGTGKHAKVRIRRVRTRLDLVRTPSTCTGGTWALGANFGLPDGTTPSFTMPVAC
jgi:hypothetical protein